MIAVLAVCLALAVIACVWLAARGSRTTRELAESRTTYAELETQLDTADTARATAESDLAGARHELDEARADLGRLRTEVDEAREAAGAADAARLEAEEQASQRADDLRIAEARVTEAEERALAAEARVAELVLEQADARPLTEVVDADTDAGPGPDTLWALELARTRRTWHTSVSADPTAETFDDGGDPLRAAVDVDVAALREEAGVDVAIVWELDQVLHGAAALAVLRSTQELLAAATRIADDARLTVRRDAGDVVIDVTEPDGTSGRFSELAGALSGRGLAPSDTGVRVLGAAAAAPT